MDSFMLRPEYPANRIPCASSWPELPFPAGVEEQERLLRHSRREWDSRHASDYTGMHR